MRSAKFAKHKILLIPLVLVAITLLSGYFLSHVPLGARAANNSSTIASVTVGVSCNMIGTETSAHTTEIINGQSQENIGTTKITTICNDTNGYAIYAVGFSGDTFGNTNMLPVDTSNNSPIATGTWRTSGDSVWNMKITKDTAEHGYGELNVVNGFDANHSVPDTYTKVASYTAKTDNVIGSSIYTTYAAYVGQTQPAGTYIGKVKYLMVHPNNNEATTLPRMQDLTLDMCKKNVANGIGEDVLVVDARDNKTYTVKYINGSCLMTQNLAFSGTTLTPQDSNVTTNTTLTYYSFVENGEQGQECYVAVDTEYIAGYDHACIVSSDSYGAYYNYAAASAMTITGKDDSSEAVSNICPKGWTLPNNSLYQNLVSYTSAFNPVAPGIYERQYASDTSMKLVRSGYNGYWWGSDGPGRGRTRLGYNTNEGLSYSPYTIGRQDGISVRCVMKNMMQNITEADLALLTNNGANTTTLYDSRDNQRYTVAKLADGKYWMTTNLNLAGGTPLYSGDSDVPNGYDATPYYILPASVSGTGENDYVDNAVSYVTNTGSTTCGENNPCYSYYSWLAAVAGNKTNVEANDVDAPYSVCPKNWKIPNTREGTNYTSDMRALSIALGGSGELQTYNASTNPTGANMVALLKNNQNSFVISGSFENSSMVGIGTTGAYWTSTSNSASNSRGLTFTGSGSYVGFASGRERKSGLAVRCLLRTE